MYTRQFEGDSVRGSKRARYGGDLEPWMEAQRGGIAEPGREAGSRIKFMLQEGYQVTDNNAGIASHHQGHGPEIHQPSQIGSYMVPNFGHIETGQTNMGYGQTYLHNVHPAHIGYGNASPPVFVGNAPPVGMSHEHTNQLASGNNVRPVTIGYQHESLPVFGGMVGPARVGHEHPDMRASGEFMHPRHMTYGQRNLQAPGDMGYPAHIGHEPRNIQVSGNVVHPGHVGYQHPNFQASEAMVRPAQMSYGEKNVQAFGGVTSTIRGPPTSIIWKYSTPNTIGSRP